MVQLHVDGGGNLILREYGNGGPRRHRILWENGVPQRKKRILWDHGDGQKTSPIFYRLRILSY